MQTTLIVLISIFLVLFTVGLGVYIVFFIIHKIYFNQETKLMEKYNQLANCVSSLNMFKLEVLANSNPAVKSNIAQIKQQYAVLDVNLKIIYGNIITLTKEIDSFNLKPAKEHIEIISADLNQNIKDFNEIKVEYERFTNYGDTIANMFNSYIELNEKLKKFYLTKIIYHSDFKKINALFEAISKTISKVPEATIKFEFKKAMIVWMDLHAKIQALVKALFAALKFQIISSYLQASINKDNEIISRSYTSIADSDKQVLQRYSATFDNSYAKMLKAYRSFDLNKAHIYAIDAILALNQINNFVTVHSKAADIIAVSLNEITNQTNAILSNKQRILDSINAIQEYFVKEQKVNTWFDTIVEDINIIQKLADQSKYVSYKTHSQKVSALLSLVTISKNISAKKEEISILIDNVNDSLNKIISSITDLNDLYIYFWQMLVMIKKVSPDDEDTKSVVSLIENNLKLIEKYTNEIIKNDNPNYLLISRNLNNIIENVHQIYSKISSNLTLKNYARKLFVYANRYRSATTKALFAKANSLYKSKKYAACIDQLIAICKKAKNKK